LIKRLGGKVAALDKLYWFFLACCGGVIVLACLAQFSPSSVWDDSYMFIRYADNLLLRGKIAWNPDGAPTFGLTALLYLIVVTPIRLLTWTTPMLTLELSSLTGGVLFVVGLFVLVKDQFGKAVLRRAIIALVLFTLALSMDQLAHHFVGGLDTPFAMAYITAYFLLIRWHERSSSLASMLLAGVWGGLAFFARPDLLLYTVTLPAFIILLNAESRSKVRGFGILGITLLVVLIEISFAMWYFQSPLPLPFYAKGMQLYGEYIYQRYAGVGLRELANYVERYWYLFFFIGASMVSDVRKWWRKTTAADKGMLIATALFLAYYAFFVLPIMYYFGRFYYPTLSAVIYLAVKGIVVLVDEWKGWFEQVVGSAPLKVWGLFALFAIALLLPAVWGDAKTLWLGISSGTWARFDLVTYYKSSRLHQVWYRLDAFSALPDDLVIATTEVGYPSVMNPGKEIIDLAGLNDTELAHARFSATAFFQENHPDLIYLPHPDYVEMNRAIEENPYFRTHYVRYAAAQWNGFLDVAVWRDSKYYSEMHKILENLTPAPVPLPSLR
jgi:hypothetical protein